MSNQLSKLPLRPHMFSLSNTATFNLTSIPVTFNLTLVSSFISKSRERQLQPLTHCDGLSYSRALYLEPTPTRMVGSYPGPRLKRDERPSDNIYRQPRSACLPRLSQREGKPRVGSLYIGLPASKWPRLVIQFSVGSLSTPCTRANMRTHCCRWDCTVLNPRPFPLPLCKFTSRSSIKPVRATHHSNRVPNLVRHGFSLIMRRGPSRTLIDLYVLQ